MIALLDLSSAFDSVNHDILLQRLQVSFGFSGTVLAWFTSFLTGRRQSVICGSSSSSSTLVPHGVPQGSVLGPLLFLLYTSDIPNIISSFGLSYHAFADDIQIYGSCPPSECDSLNLRMSQCISAVFSWLKSNRLMPNSAKTDIMWLSSNRRRHLLPQSPTIIDNLPICPAPRIRNLGVPLDHCLSMRPFISSTLQKCFGALRQLRSIRSCLSEDVLTTLVSSLILSRIDFCNSLLYGLPRTSLLRLQSALNASARLIFKSRTHDHVTPFLRRLQWLPIRERISYKLAVLTFKCLRDDAPSYLSSQLSLVSSMEFRRCLRSSASRDLILPTSRLKTVGARAFPIAAVRVWNQLPLHLKLSNSLYEFKKNLKAELLLTAYT